MTVADDSQRDPIARRDPATDRMGGDDGFPQVGEWYHVQPNRQVGVDEDSGYYRHEYEKDVDTCWNRDAEAWLGCVTEVGSNYAELEGVRYKSRIHFDNFWKRCARVFDPNPIIDREIRDRQQEVRSLMAEVRTLTARLSITTEALPAPGSETQALARCSSNEPVEEYKAALILAEKKTLPDLFKRIKAASEGLAAWMKAPLIPMEAQVDELSGVLKKVKGRIFNVELYAGLIEELEQIRDGEPAAVGERVRLIQHRAYMDEECLAQYRTGGMDFKSIGEFDAWLAEPAHRDRILPYQRCLIAFRVRRKEKERRAYSLSDFFRIADEYKLDKLTFLYIRNGDQMYRLSTGIEFGEQLFPDLDRAQLAGRVWAKMCNASVERLYTEGDFQAMIAKEDEEEREYAKRGVGPGVSRTSKRCYEFTPDCIYHDEIGQFIADEMERHNRLVLVLQGLLDRSPALHPHPPWQLWTAAGFAAGLELIYDASRGLTAGPPPDFEAYRARLNASLAVGSVTVGQEEAWERHEADKANARRDRDWRDKGNYRPERVQPYGDPGPGTLARVVGYKGRAKRCSYHWTRKRQGTIWDAWGNRLPDRIPCTIEVPASKLLNVSAYTPGDFHLFFDDPRTRADYLQWAPLLLEAEEFHAGNRKVGTTEEDD